MGIHGAGSAREANKNWAAVWGVGSGPTGQAYAIPTKPAPYKTSLPIDVIKSHVQEFFKYAREHPDLQFVCVKVGCGRAGYTVAEMAPLWRGAPPNVLLHVDFKIFLDEVEDGRSRENT